jgi:hypothetical protein
MSGKLLAFSRRSEAHPMSASPWQPTPARRRTR